MNRIRPNINTEIAIRWLIVQICFACLVFTPSYAQEYKQLVRGVIIDLESHRPVAGVNIRCETCHPTVGCASDSLGQFELKVSVGRHSFSFTHVAYEARILHDIQVGSGKEIYLETSLSEKVYQANEIAVRAGKNRSINQMATVSARTLRSQDATRYAGGYFDAARMVSNFPGVASGNNDDSNEIVIRGNSPRGILWRIEGIEIPNPNHFSSGEGASGGGYASVSTNVLSGFDFFTGSFPAEYGNAYSGVLDMNLRKGNTEKHEFAVGLSVLGLEAAAEGPIKKEDGSSYLFNFRRADFTLLTKYNIIDDTNLGIVPKTFDWASKISFRTPKKGTFELFGIGGTSSAGDVASSTSVEAKQGGDLDEFFERHAMSVTGVKHNFVLPNSKTYIRTTAAFTYDFHASTKNVIDTALAKTLIYYDNFEYKAFRLASMVNHKINARNSLRFGLAFNYIWSDLFSKRLNKAVYDTLVNDRDQGWYGGYHLQWKYKTPKLLETNTGIHIMHSGINHELVVEPRFGLVINLPGQNSFSLGSGFHSRIEALSVYSYRVKISTTQRDAINKNLKTIKAFHLTAGYHKTFGEDFQLGIEAYFQQLYDVPVNLNTKSQYSILNLISGLPDLTLTNSGKGKNKGVEITFEKSFSHNYFFLATASLFDSKYRAPDGMWYNTYYNTSFVYNLLAGKEFQFGSHKQNTFGIKFRGMYRGGFRYSPPDITQSLKNKRLTYNVARTNELRLPDFRRIDFGLSYKWNRQKLAWVFLADIQNILDTHNILRRKFEYKNKAVLTYETQSYGLVPVLTIRLEF